MMRLIAPLLLVASAAGAEPPGLAVYVTDEGQDRYVALYDTQAVELAGCTGVTQARNLLALADTVQPAEQTQAALTEGFALGAAPRIPCSEADFALDWPAATGIWADPGGSGRYYLPMPGGPGYAALPSRCTGLRTVFAIRARLQLPGVLLGTGLPPDLGDGPALVLDCGDAQPGQGTTIPTTPQTAGAWSLHRFDTFLSEASAGDTIPVLRFRPSETAPAGYLPVLRVDGVDTRDTLLAGGAEAARLEDALARLIGADPETPVTALGGEAVAALRVALYADLCLTGCVDYAHRHAVFLSPDSDLGVTVIDPPAPATRMDRLGSVAQVMTYAEGRSLSLVGCDGLAQALGMVAKPGDDWQAAAAAAVDDTAPAATILDCRASGPDLCLRRVAEGGALTPAMLAPGPDCPGAARLRVELPAALTLPTALTLTGPAFAQVELAPAPGIARSTLTITPSRLAASDGSCVLAPVDALIAATGVPRLVLTAIDLRRAPTPEGPAAREALGIQVQSGALVLNGSTIDASDQPLQRGINLCLADLYATDSSVTAQATAVQALASRLLLTGRSDAALRLAAGRFGMLLMPGTMTRLSQVEIIAATPVVLRGALLDGGSVVLGAEPGAPGSGMQLERAARADLTISRIAGFRCAVSFADAASASRLMLPGNDLARDNTHTACGPGRLEVLE
ncbi:hypothetical protein [Paracoccus sp. SSK6]|uniref:hypothetical protein n=1 Tax=Paracoccus sp. SSK6 TaxID=3143131 RepID=UPI0032194A5D